jgi:hypothetical protein
MIINKSYLKIRILLEVRSLIIYQINERINNCIEIKLYQMKKFINIQNIYNNASGLKIIISIFLRKNNKDIVLISNKN